MSSQIKQLTKSTTAHRILPIISTRFTTAKIHLSPEIKKKYSEIVPVLSGKGNSCSITLLGRRRDDPKKLDRILTRAWQQDEPVSIVWDAPPPLSSHSS